MMVAVNVICVCAVFMLNVAVPKDAGRRAPLVRAGQGRILLASLVRFTTKLLGDSPADTSRLSTYWALVRVADICYELDGDEVIEECHRVRFNLRICPRRTEDKVLL